jgi:hypothetical protein
MMGYTYILVIWTVVAVQGQGTGNYNMHRERDWRPIGEFQREEGHIGPSYKTALEMCEAAARQLNLKPETYRCVRSK